MQIEKNFLKTAKKTVEEEIKALEKTLAMLNFKCWYYERALADGNEDKIKEMLPDKLPSEIQESYDKAHS